jgi:hypothetical protein
MKNSQLDFTGQTLYIGIDVHKKSWQVTILLNGMKVKVFSMNPNPKVSSFNIFELDFCSIFLSIGLLNIKKKWIKITYRKPNR